jgi:GTP cyclohydrolase FolE2
VSKWVVGGMKIVKKSKDVTTQQETVCPCAQATHVLLEPHVVPRTIKKFVNVFHHYKETVTAFVKNHLLLMNQSVG